jgi:hypothetical protein
MERRKRLSKTARPDALEQSAGEIRASLGLLDLVRLQARQAAREQHSAGFPRIEEGYDDQAVAARRASLDH